jgi:uncharacterized membrane protein
MNFSDVIEHAGKVIDAAGVILIVLGAVVATVMFALRLWKRRTFEQSYTSYRRALGRSILLGLEVLVAADIIRTVAVSPSFKSVGVLAIVVVIRTFLSWSLELEMTHRWPWQSEAGAGEA